MSITSINDTDLILRLKSHEAQAFDALYRKYHKGIYNNAIKLTRDITIAEEIVQETFIALWEKRNTLDTQKDLAGWLYTVSYNKTITHFREATKKIEYQHALLNLEDSPSGEINAIALENQWQLLEQAVDQLSAQKRRVFELCKIEGKTYEETALEMGISKYTVKEYLSDAVELIKKYIQQHRIKHAFLVAYLFLENFL